MRDWSRVSLFLHLAVWFQVSGAFACVREVNVDQSIKCCSLEKKIILNIVQAFETAKHSFFLFFSPPIFEPGTHAWNVAQILRIGFTCPCGSQVRREYVCQGSQSSRLSVLSCTFHIFVQNVSSVHRANVQKGEFG